MKTKTNLALPNAGAVVEITARHCPEKVSPLLQPGKRFIVKGVEPLSANDDTPVLVLWHPTRKHAALRANANRFDWRIITAETLREEAFKREVANDTRRMFDAFSNMEQIQIVFVPLIYNHIAWCYAIQAMQTSADKRISVLKKVTRAVHKLREAYLGELGRDLDRRHITHIEDETERFMSHFQDDFIILYFTVNRELLKRVPDYPYMELRCYAIISMLFIRLVKQHNKRMEELIASRLGSCKGSVSMPIMNALYTCMSAYAGEIDNFDWENTDIRRCMKVVRNNIKKIEFEIT